VPTKGKENRLLVFESNVLRTVYGPKIVDRSSNFELDREFNRPNVISVVMSNRLRYVRHFIFTKTRLTTFEE
jgi:hypothetical protein